MSLGRDEVLENRKAESGTEYSRGWGSHFNKVVKEGLPEEGAWSKDTLSGGRTFPTAFVAVGKTRQDRVNSLGKAI